MSTDDNISSIVEALFPEGYTGYALEIGASDGVYLSNTLYLENKGWQVLCIEPNPIYFEDLKDNRKICLNYACSSKNEDNKELMIYDREGIPSLGWEAGEPVSALGGLSKEFIKSFCPDVREPNIHLVNVRTLDFCLEEVGFSQLDFLSLDVDGIELDILKGFDIKRWGTKVVSVENPFSNIAISAYLIDAGFEIIDKTHVNEIWRKTS